MASTQDSSVGIVKEVTYKTAVVQTRWLEFLDESLDFNKNVKQGMGLRVAARVARSGRRVVPTADGGGDWSLECVSKGMGLLWEGCLGTGVSTLVSGSTQQQVFTLGDTPPSWSLQKGIVEAGGTVDAYSFLGAMVDNWELAFPNGDIATLKMGMDVGNVSTAIGYAAPSYASEPVNLFHFANATISTGALTAPTATVLGSCASPTANIRGGSIQVSNNLRGDRYNAGGAGRKAKPTVGLRAISGKIDVEYDAITYRDLVMNDTPMSLLVQFTGGALSTGVETLQVIIPEIKFDSELPKVNGTDLVVQSMSFQGLDNLTAAQPIWVVTRTADSAL